MADLLEKLWPAFISEVTEQLDTVELLLAKHDAAKTLDVNQLFRNFHTIKGSCSMIGFTSMEAIAHHSEDILSAVRNKEIVLDEQVIDILLESISCLKTQFHTSSQNRQDPKQDEPLLQRLIAFVDERLQTDKNEEENTVSAVDLQSALTQASRMAVPVMVLGLDPGAKIEQVEKAVNGMADAALQNGFRSLSGALRHYIDILKTPSEEKTEPLIEQLAEVFELIHLIAQEHKLDLNLDMGARLCRSKLAAPYLDVLEQLDTLLTALQETSADQWQAGQFFTIVTLCNQLGHYSALFNLLQLQQSWRYVRQLVVEVSRSYLVFNNPILAKIQEISSLAKEKKALSGGDEAFELQCKNLREELQTLTAKHNNERDEIVELKEAIISKTSLCMDSLVDLKMDVLEKIHSAIEEGRLAVEIDIDFTDEVVSEKVLKAVRTLGELAHSRTMFHDIVNGIAQRTSFSFLILSQKSREDIKTILSIIDREQKTFTILDKEAPPAETSVVAEQEDTSPDAVADDDDASAEDALNTSKLAAETSLSLSSLKVEGSAIDRVINDVGELVTHQNRFSHLVSQNELGFQINQLKSLVKDMGEKGRLVHSFFEDFLLQLNSTNETMQVSLSRIQSSVLDLRVVPVAYVFNRFHSFVRSTAQRLNKKVALELIGEHVKVDKGMIDVLAEPLAHIVRNSIDHGIESPDVRKAQGKNEVGVIRLSAIQHSETVIIEIADDGAGLNKQVILDKCIEKGLLKANTDYIDADIYKQIFEPGFSTSKILTETSGRGVGMDVVKSRITEVGGTVSVSSEPGKGAVIRLRLPVSAAIQSVILIDNNGQTLAIPERHVAEVISVQSDDIQTVQEQSAIMLRDMIVPIYRLSDLLQVETSDQQQAQYEVLILTNEQSTMGLIVDEVFERSEILVRDVHESLRRMPGVSAASILGDGRVVIILDCAGLFELAINNAQNIFASDASL